MTGPVPDAAPHPWLAFDHERAHRVITRFVESYVQGAGATGVTLGLSGGIDSALTAALCVDALGTEAVDVVAMPGPTSSEEDEAVAREVAQHLGLELARVPIAKAAEALAPELGVEVDRGVRANLQARLRMTVLYARAQARGRLVAGTGNKTELLTGYFTKHGDGAADLSPIGDLYKQHVVALSRHLGLPERVVARPPTAGLWQGQTDEAELGITYEALDVVLAGFERQADHDDIARAAGVDLAEVSRIEGMVERTWHKRNPLPVPKLGWRTVGVDWRHATQ